MQCQWLHDCFQLEKLEKRETREKLETPEAREAREGRLHPRMWMSLSTLPLGQTVPRTLDRSGRRTRSHLPNQKTLRRIPPMRCRLDTQPALLQKRGERRKTESAEETEHSSPVECVVPSLTSHVATAARRNEQQERRERKRKEAKKRHKKLLVCRLWMRPTTQ